jgi:hypothetical protein
MSLLNRCERLRPESLGTILNVGRISTVKRPTSHEPSTFTASAHSCGAAYARPVAKESSIEAYAFREFAAQDSILDFQIADVPGLFKLGRAGDQQQQTLVEVLYRGTICRAWPAREMASLLHPGVGRGKAGFPQPTLGRPQIVLGHAGRIGMTRRGGTPPRLANFGRTKMLRIARETQCRDGEVFLQFVRHGSALCKPHSEHSTSVARSVETWIFQTARSGYWAISNLLCSSPRSWARITCCFSKSE